jgi:3-deoxy-7-phosphoheptulonate synthase
VIIVMKPDATTDQVDHMVAHVSALGMKPQVLVGTQRTVIAAIGDERLGLLEALEPGEGVEKVLPILAPYKRASSEIKTDRTVVRARGLEVGGVKVAVIAGPCSVESEKQIVGLARQLKAKGATGLRGGAFKPRTSPYSFQGHKEDGLKMLAAARQETGLAIVTEVMAPEHVPMVAEYADVLQIGARNMQNYQLLQAVGDSGKPALLKRGMSATIDEFLLAAEYILDRGNSQVMLCERGIRTYEEHTRFTLPLATVPYLHDKSHLPVVVDPSHGTGKANLVVPMARAAVAAGADALLVEVHDDPEHAMSDGSQTITPHAFSQMMTMNRGGGRSYALSPRPPNRGTGMDVPDSVITRSKDRDISAY